MEIRITSVKFDADKKLVDFINKKVGKLDKFFDGLMAVDVTLSIVPDYQNKKTTMRAEIPGNDIVVERNCESFEEAVSLCVDILKEQLIKAKEKMRKK
ncbi:MAG: ribosome-associated translation inhibitor RaiA [Bacteroidales bacterium]|nr:ribosome-associated translation inhibitor RaiA [Bacteroidales bacterium]MCL2739287.1 ribosome-associated translation inhibitor RaiA [Bacteroidales bacterium]